MKYTSSLIFLLLFFLIGCNTESTKTPSAQQVVDSAIVRAGGKGFRINQISFDFRNRTYKSYLEDGQRVLARITPTDSGDIQDLRKGDSFKRIWKDSLLAVPDTTAQKWSNAVNSVHYFAYLPYGLNDAAVNKEMLGMVQIGEDSYYKVRVTFKAEGGGEDFEDVFIYWFDSQTYNPDFLAYEFHTNGGGLRFREGFNPRRVGGLKFQDYINYKPSGNASLLLLDSLFIKGELEELSRIELQNIQVSPGSYN
jgi:hypothetical protein